MNLPHDSRAGVDVFNGRVRADVAVHRDQPAAGQLHHTLGKAVGAEKARQDVERLTENAIAQLDAFEDSDFLETLARYLVNREK